MAPRWLIRTGSGHSVDGTSGRWQGAPFAGSLPLLRLCDLALLPMVGSAGGLDGQMVTGGPGVSALGSATRPATRSAARSRTATPPRQKRGKEGGRCGSSVGEGSSCLSRACSLGTEGLRAARRNPSREEILEKVALERERELAGCPAKILSSGRRADSRLLSGSAGSTRLMKHGVQCSRGSRDDRSERAPGPILSSRGLSKEGPLQERIRRALTSPLGNSRSRRRQRLRAFTGARQRSRSWQGEGSIPRS